MWWVDAEDEVVVFQFEVHVRFLRGSWWLQPGPSRVQVQRDLPKPPIL